MKGKKENHRVPRTDEERKKEENHLLLLHANEKEPYRFPLLIMKNRVDSA